MDLFSRDQLRELAQAQEQVCVSLYMPTFHVESELSQNPIRLKNLIKQARAVLKEHGSRDAEIEEVLRPAQSLVESETYWRNVDDGLAIFLAPSYSRIYRLPIPFPELVVTSTRFHLKQLFPILANDNRFYVIAISQDSVRLFMGTRYNIKELKSRDIPKSLNEALWYDEPSGRESEVRPGAKGNRLQSRTSFHGHGQTEADLARRPNDELYRFLQEIDEGVMKVIGDDNAPLVLAGVDYYLPIYREVNNYARLIDESIISGSPDYLPNKHLKQLHEKAWNIVEPIFQEDQKKATRRFMELHSKNDHLTSDDLKEIVPAAVFSRIEDIFVPVGRQAWGRYDSEKNTVSIHDTQKPGDDDLLDLAAVYTYLNGGAVHALKPENMPVKADLAATFRFPANVSADMSHG